MSGIAVGRLTEERKSWRRDHPAGFYARPARKADNSSDIMKWETGIPGKEGTDWEGGIYKVTLAFSENYPSKPPSCKFVPPIFHPNVFSCGSICLSILKEEDGWRPSVSIKQILLAIQDLFTNANCRSPANTVASDLLQKRPAEYAKRIREQAIQFGMSSDEVEVL